MLSDDLNIAFETWADDKGFDLSVVLMSSDGVPDNPYTDPDTKLAYEIWSTALAEAEPIIRKDERERVAIMLDEQADAAREFANIQAAYALDGAAQQIRSQP